MPSLFIPVSCPLNKVLFFFLLASSFEDGVTLASRRTSVPGVPQIREIVSTSAANSAVTLLLRNCRLLNVHSGEICETDIAISGDRIVSIDRFTGNSEKTVECAGKLAVPGMIDAHMHVDTTFLWPGELARILVPLTLRRHLNS